MDKFWGEYRIPYQEEDTDFDFVNSVVVQRILIKDIDKAAEISERLEAMQKVVDDLENELSDAKRELAAFRRKILADHFDQIKTSASTEIQEAFIYRMAKQDGVIGQLNTLEDKVDRLNRSLEQKYPAIKKFSNRLRMLEKKSDRAVHYLNHERLILRLEEHGSRV